MLPVTGCQVSVLISFREWLHSYLSFLLLINRIQKKCSHLFQRVASFLHFRQTWSRLGPSGRFSSLSESGFIPTPETSWRGTTQSSWKFSSLSESGFIPTYEAYPGLFWQTCSHLFQRVASFLRWSNNRDQAGVLDKFSSLSESGFIPTKKQKSFCIDFWLC